MKQSEALNQLPTQFFSNLVQKVNQKMTAGIDVINLGQGNPDQPTPENIIYALQRSAELPGNHKYSSPFSGKASLKEAVADFYKREYQVSLDPQTEVAILFGTKAGLVELPFCLLNPGELMLLPDPYYPDYLSGVALAKVQTEFMPLLEENNFLPDYRSLSKETLEKAQLMYLNYPNNPTGAVATSAFFEDTVQLAQQENIIVAHDFAYGALGFDGKKPISFLETQGAKEAGIEFYSLSKTYNMAGWRVGFAVGNADVISSITLYQDHMFVSLFPAIQDAAQEAMLGDQSSVKRLLALYESRRDTFVSAAAKIGWRSTSSSGSFFVWMPVPKGFSSTDFADLLLEKAGVMVAPGRGFGDHGEGYVRIGLLDSNERLVEAVARIENLHLFK